MPKIMAIDIETYSNVDLLDSGVRPYIPCSTQCHAIRGSR